jgi:hypothetical protein
MNVAQRELVDANLPDTAANQGAANAGKLHRGWNFQMRHNLTDRQV